MKGKKLVLGFVLGACLAGGAGFWYVQENRPISDYEKNVNAITEIDYDKQQEELDQIVADGQINIQYSLGTVFNGTVSESFNVKNIKNNHHPLIFTLYDENDDVIYESKQIEPGYEINQIELTKKLSKGTHNGTIKIGYATEGNVASVFPITIEVK